MGNSGPGKRMSIVLRQPSFFAKKEENTVVMLAYTL